MPKVLVLSERATGSKARASCTSGNAKLRSTNPKKFAVKEVITKAMFLDRRK